MNFGNVYGLQYVIMVTDLGIADTFDYKYAAYSNTNPVLELQCRVLLLCLLHLQPNGFSLFLQNSFPPKNNNQSLLFLRDGLR
ncbi:hypothetical protein DQX05_05130 [Paenibacillus thiaminolyticus]|uniref:Uncharacterized protein n=1 Tax=Paenibacillus thiaminolyticus TaxID=49283 RepID=A0A3A3H2B9_PANTH|nr:hypothetical protein DQX05_05130 [Paenibacillus thiaminolyticus]